MTSKDGFEDTINRAESWASAGTQTNHATNNHVGSILNNYKYGYTQTTVTEHGGITESRTDYYFWN